MAGYIDMHCDTLTSLMGKAQSGDLMENNLSVDLQRLQNNGNAIEFFARFIYLDRFKSEAGEALDNAAGQGRWDLDRAWAYTMDVLDFYEENQKKYSQSLYTIKSARGARFVLSREKPGLCGGLLTVEEGGILDGSMERLNTLFDRGVRLMTLTWNFDNCLGHPNSRDASKNALGLTPFGFSVIEAMEKMGMMVDVSHLSDGGFYDVAQHMKKPFVASHSNARALCPHPRNLTDHMIRTLADHGGVAGLNFCPAFLDEKNGSTVEAMTAHVHHMIRVGGEDVVALGTDFDGISGPLEIPHTGKMELLYHALKTSGLTQRVLDKIWYGNVLRVMEDVMGDL